MVLSIGDQAQHIRPMLEPLCKRRVRAEVGAPVAPVLEFALPAELSPEQRGCYRTVLTRFYEVLADPRPPRNAGHRSVPAQTAAKAQSATLHLPC